jgi:hypothetical protein
MGVNWMSRKCSLVDIISKWRRLKYFQSFSKLILISHRTMLRFAYSRSQLYGTEMKWKSCSSSSACSH